MYPHHILAQLPFSFDFHLSLFFCLVGFGLVDLLLDNNNGFYVHGVCSSSTCSPVTGGVACVLAVDEDS